MNGIMKWWSGFVETHPKASKWSTNGRYFHGGIFLCI